MAGLTDADVAGGSDGAVGAPEPGDIAFRIARPRPSPLAFVGIDSVLYPLYGRVGALEQRQAQTYRLIELWRRRIGELVELGWHPAGSPDPTGAARRVRQIRNCSPPFVPVHPNSSCGLSSLCPLCWGREAMRIWTLADAVFFPPDPRSGRRPERAACGLVETARTHRLPATEPQLLASFLADRVRRPPRGMPLGPYFRPHEFQTYPSIGGYETIAISAGARGRAPGAWEVAIRQLLAVAPEHVGLLQPPQYKNIRIKVVRHTRPDRMELARAVARLCRYPPWLLRGDPEQVLGSLEARAGLRLGAAFGNFRGAPGRRGSASS